MQCFRGVYIISNLSEVVTVLFFTVPTSHAYASSGSHIQRHIHLRRTAVNLGFYRTGQTQYAGETPRGMGVHSPVPQAQSVTN